jgi:hypothetical protein
MMPEFFISSEAAVSGVCPMPVLQGTPDRCSCHSRLLGGSRLKTAFSLSPRLFGFSRAQGVRRLSSLDACGFCGPWLLVIVL